MVKYKAGDREMSFWVDSENGSLNIESEMGVTEISYHDTGRLLGLIQQDRAVFKEMVDKENDVLNRLWKKVRQ